MLKANIGYVIVEVLKNENVSVGGIIIPENSVKPSNRGTVIDIGYEDTEFKENDTVFFPLYAGHKINYADNEYIILKEEDILAFETGE